MIHRRGKAPMNKSMRKEGTPCMSRMYVPKVNPARLMIWTPSPRWVRHDQEAKGFVEA